MKNTMEMNKLNMDEIEMVNGGTGPLANAVGPVNKETGPLGETGPLASCDPPCKTGSFDTTGPVDETGPIGYPYGYPY